MKRLYIPLICTTIVLTSCLTYSMGKEYPFFDDAPLSFNVRERDEQPVDIHCRPDLLVRVLNCGINNILSDLSDKDITNLHKTCRALRFVWDHERKIEENRIGKIPSLVRSLVAMNAQNPVHLGTLRADTHCTIPKEITYIANLKELVLVIPKRDGIIARLYAWWHGNNNPWVIVGNCAQLQGLYLECSDTTERSKEIQNLHQLKKLTLVGNCFTPAICNCLQLKALALNCNYLYSLPEELRNLQQLRYLELSFNHLTPKAIANVSTWCPRLHVLGLGFNQLATLPAEIAQLIKLKKLGLTGNDFSPEEQNRIRQLLPNAEIIF